MVLLNRLTVHQQQVVVAAAEQALLPRRLRIRLGTSTSGLGS